MTMRSTALLAAVTSWMVQAAGCGDNPAVRNDAAVEIDAAVDAPSGLTISQVPDQIIDEDSTTGPLGFTVSDPSGAALGVTATSNNQVLLPDDNLALGGSGANRTIIAVPAANQFGSAVVTLAVTSGTETATSSFTLVVAPVNDLPTISMIATQTTTPGVATPAIPFTVSDIETAATSLVVTATTSNPTLVPLANLQLQGSGGNRTITVTPAAAGLGSATITVSVSDGTASTSRMFDLVVMAASDVNDPPVNHVPGAQTTPEDVPLAFVGVNAISISDIDAGTAAVRVTLTTTIGVLGLGGTAGLTFTTGDGVGDPTMTFTGTITAINTALAGLTLATATNTFGSGTLTILTNDLGNTGIGGPQSDSDTVAISVTSVNDAPTITQIANLTINEDTTTGPLAFVIGDVETPAASLVTTATSSNPGLVPAANLVLAGAGANRTIAVTPAANQFGSTIVTVTVADTDGGTTDMVFTVSVTGVNDRPTIENVPDQSMNLGSSLVVPFVVGDAETPAGSLVVTAMTSNAAVSGAPVLGGAGANRTVTFTPSTNGTATITLTVSDTLLTASDTFVLTVNDFNDPPVVTVPATQLLHSIIASAAANQRDLLFRAADHNTISVADPDAGAATISVSVTASAGTLTATAAPAGGTLTGNGTGILVFTGAQAEINARLEGLDLVAPQNFFGAITVTVTADDGGNSGTGGALQDTKQVTVNVNARPVISAVPNATIAEDGQHVVGFTVEDADNLVGTLVLTGTSSRDALVPDANVVVTGTGAARTITITPLPNANSVSTGGNATITIRATDPLGGVDTEVLTLTVTQVNDAPINATPGPQTSHEDVPLVFSTANGNAITFTDVDLTETGGPNATGQARIQLTASVGTIALSSVAAALPALGGNGTGSLDMTGTRAQLLAAMNGMRLIPPQDYFGPATLTVVTDDRANANATILSDTDAIAVTFTAVNDGPTITSVSDLATVLANVARTGLVVQVADVDVGSGQLEVTMTTTASDGTLTLPTLPPSFITGDGVDDSTIVFRGTLAQVNAVLANFTFDPIPGFFGDTSIQVSINDLGNTGAGGALNVTAIIPTTYSPTQNTPPTITAVNDVTVAEDTSTGPIAFVVGDLQTLAGSLDVTVTSAAGFTVTLGGSGANRTVTVDPAPNFTGMGTFTLSVSDGTAAPATEAFTVTVTPVNDAPTIVPNPIGPQSTLEDTALVVSFIASDVETASGSLGMFAFTNNPSLITVGPITTSGVTLTPRPNQTGTATVFVSVSDGMLTQMQSFVVTVIPVNDAPTVTASGKIVVGDLEQTTLRVTLDMSAGETVTLGTIAGLTFTAGDGLNDDFMTFTGTIAAINAALNDLVTTGGTLDIEVNDLTNTPTAISNTSRVGQFGP